MRIPDMSRRTFVKTALAGAAGALMSGVGESATKERGAAGEASLSMATLAEASQLVAPRKSLP